MLPIPHSHPPFITRPHPSLSTFTFPTTPSTTINITLPPTSTFTTSPHFHVSHTEYIRVLCSAALVTIGNRTLILQSSDASEGDTDVGVLEIPRGARHEWIRFDRDPALLSAQQREVQRSWLKGAGEEEVERLRKKDLIVEEWTDPADGQKEVFFRNLFGTLLEPAFEGMWAGEWRRWLWIWVVQWEGDNFLVVVDFGGGWVERGVILAIMGVLWGMGGES